MIEETNWQVLTVIKPASFIEETEYQMFITAYDSATDAADRQMKQRQIIDL